MEKFWSAEETKIIFQYYGKITVKEIQGNHLPHRTCPAIRGKAVRLGLKSNLTVKANPRPQFAVGLPSTNNMDFDELWEAAYAFQKAATMLSTRLDPVDVVLDVDYPIALAFVADIHIGAISTPLDVVRNRFELMAQYPWLYLISAGDTIDNYLPSKHPQGMFGQIFPPELQKDLVENLYSKMEGRWIALVQGCHDDFSHQTDDFDFTKYMATKLRCANLGFGGQVNLTVGDQLYEVAVRHKYRYNSSFNFTHTCKRLREREYPNADIVCVAHHHQANIEQMAHADKDRVYIRPGSMKGPDRYARSLGYRDTGQQIPIVILHPDERKMMIALDLEQAVEWFK